MDYRDRLKELRIQNKKGQKDIALLCDVSDSTVGHWEKKRRHMTIDCLIKLCKYYNVSADFILGFSDTPIHNRFKCRYIMETSQQKKSS
ncbi:MAG: helix-turn-helix domain-containing protein [Acutalibacteraceae bacterium]